MSGRLEQFGTVALVDDLSRIGKNKFNDYTPAELAGESRLVGLLSSEEVNVRIRQHRGKGLSRRVADLHVTGSIE